MLMETVWTYESVKNYRQNLDYLVKEWDYSVVADFIEKVECCIELIKENWNIGSYEKVLDCHKILVVQQIYLFYEIKDNVLIIHNIWNTKRKPYWSE